METPKGARYLKASEQPGQKKDGHHHEKGPSGRRASSKASSSFGRKE